MAAFLDFVRARLMSGDTSRDRAGGNDMRVPAAGEPFGRPTALRLHWELNRTGGLTSSWKPTSHRSRKIPPS